MLRIISDKQLVNEQAKRFMVMYREYMKHDIEDELTRENLITTLRMAHAQIPSSAQEERDYCSRMLAIIRL